MLKRVLKTLGIGISIGLLGLSLCAPFFQSRDMTSISRPYKATEYTYIGDTYPPLSGNINFTSLDMDVVDEINEVREEMDLDPYEFDEGLGAAAYVRAEECEQKFSHTRPNGSKWYTVNQNICFGENLAYGYDTADDVVDAWLDSPTHRDLIYDDEFETCGIGHYKGSDGTTYIACEFGY